MIELEDQKAKLVDENQRLEMQLKLKSKFLEKKPSTNDEGDIQNI